MLFIFAFCLCFLPAAGRQPGTPPGAIFLDGQKYGKEPPGGCGPLDPGIFMIALTRKMQRALRRKDARGLTCPALCVKSGKPGCVTAGATVRVSPGHCQRHPTPRTQSRQHRVRRAGHQAPTGHTEEYVHHRTAGESKGGRLFQGPSWSAFLLPLLFPEGKRNGAPRRGPHCRPAASKNKSKKRKARDAPA